MSVTAAKALQLFARQPTLAPQTIADSAAHVSALVDQLEAMSAAGKVLAITLTDASPPALSVTAAQMSADAGVLARIGLQPHAVIYVSSVAANGIAIGHRVGATGSKGHPFATLAAAEAVALPGQTILLNGLASAPTAYVGGTLTASNVTIDCVQAFGATLTAAGGAALRIAPTAGGTVTLGKVIVDGGAGAGDAVQLLGSPAGAYSVVFAGSRFQNFGRYGVSALSKDVSAMFAGASFTSAAGALSAIRFGAMASGSLDVTNCDFTISQALKDVGGIVEAQASAPGAHVSVSGSRATVTSVAGSAGEGYAFGIRLVNIAGARIEDNAIKIDASAASQWGVKAVSITPSPNAQALDSGGFFIARNTIYGATSFSMTGIEIGSEGAQADTRGRLNGGLIFGNTVSSSLAAQRAEAQGVFVGSDSNADVWGNTLTGLGIAIVDKNGLGAVYYANRIADCAINYILLKGSHHATVVGNSILEGAGVYETYGLHVESNPATGDASTGSIVAGNQFASTSAQPLFIAVDAGQQVDLSRNQYRATNPLFFGSWQWLGVFAGSPVAWRDASGERGGSFTRGAAQAGPLDPYPLPLAAPAPLTPAQRLGDHGVAVTGVAASQAALTAAASQVVSVSVIDTAAAVKTSLDALQTVAMAGQLGSITLSDAHAPALRLSATRLIADAAALSAIASPYDLEIVGPLAALQAVKLPVAIVGHLGSGLTIADSAADVASALDGLQVLAAAGDLASIALTDGGTPTLAIAGRDLIVDAGALSAVSGDHILLVTGGLDNEGSLRVDGDRITVTGAVTGAGSFQIASGSVVFQSAFDQDVIFTGATGSLGLAGLGPYLGAISGFSRHGGTTVDLLRVPFAGQSAASFVGDASGGVVTITEGVMTAQIRLVGDYTGARFVASSDGHGGTRLADPTHLIAASARLGAERVAGGHWAGHLEADARALPLHLYTTRRLAFA